jgi:hypothetical protein
MTSLRQAEVFKAIVSLVDRVVGVETSPELRRVDVFGAAWIGLLSIGGVT